MSPRVTAQDLAALHRRPPRPRRERDIQRAILDALRLLPGVVAWKTGGGLLPLADGRRVRMGRKGVADIIGWQRIAVEIGSGIGEQQFVHVANFLAIEVKRPGQQPTDEQRAFLDAVRAAGGIAIVASSVDDVLAVLTPARPGGAG